MINKEKTISMRMTFHYIQVLRYHSKVAMILLLAFITRHNLTNEAISDLFYIINLICPKPNRCCKSSYKFKKYFSFMITPTSFCYYCPTCFSLIDTTINMIWSVASEYLTPLMVWLAFGFFCKSPNLYLPFTSKVILLAGTCDLPKIWWWIPCNLMGCMDVINAISQALQLVPMHVGIPMAMHTPLMLQIQPAKNELLVPMLLMLRRHI